MPLISRKNLRRGRTNFIHRWHAAQTIGEWFGNEEIGWRFEHINHVRSLVQYVWRCGPFAEATDGSGRVPLPDFPHSLNSIVTPVAAQGHEHLDMAVRHAILVANAPKLGGPPQPPQRKVEEYAARHPDIVTFADRFIALYRAMLRFYMEMRLIIPAEAGRYRNGVIPLLTPIRLGVDGANQLRGELAQGGGLPGDLVAAIQGIFAYNIKDALANRAKAELFETLAQHSNGKRIASETQEWQARSAVVVVALVGGVRKRFVVHDKALAVMLNSIFEKQMPKFVQWLAAVRTAVSAMITTMPVFIVKNFFRDTLAGFVAGRYAQLPFLGTLSGGLHAIHDMATGNSKAMRDYLLQGGFYSGLVESETDLGEIRGDGNRIKRGVALKRKWARIIHLLTRPAWIAEAGTRVNQFLRARAAGANDYAAARAARMVSADFANIGASRGWRMYIHTVPFLNAAIQGLDQLYQIFRRPWRSDKNSPRRSKDQAQHVRKVLVSGFCLSLMSAVAWVYNTSDPERMLAYQSETDYDKASWVTLYDLGGNTDIRIPVPFQIGATFIKLPEVALDLVSGTETLAGPKFIWSLVHGSLAVGWIPAVAQPIVEVKTNRNFFGAEIVPPYMQSWSPERQYFARSTPMPYRHVGEWFGVSPLHLQTYVRGWTGHLGNAVVTTLDELIWDSDVNGPKPFPRTFRLLTGVYSLQPPMPRTYTRHSNEFYEIREWGDKNRVSGCPRRSNPGGNYQASLIRFRALLSARIATGQLTRSDAAICELRTIASRYANVASDLRRRGDDVRTHSRLTREEKEVQLTGIYSEIDRELRGQLPHLRELKRQWREFR